jgi:hypothetical protein
MNDKGLPLLTTVLEHERSGGLSEADDAACFEQAMSYGWFHEDDSDWPTLAESLSRRQIASLYPAICHAIIRGGEGFSHVLVEAYQLLERWQAEQLPDIAHLARCLEAIRKLVFKAGLSSKTLWWVELSITMRLIEYAVASGSNHGGHPIMQDYESFGNEFEEIIAKPSKR